MKKKGLILLSIISLFLCSCSKLTDDFLIDSYWTGQITSSLMQVDEKIDVSFDFSRGKANFTFLEYGEFTPETGVLLYNAEGDRLIIEKANPTLNGEWFVRQKDKKSMTLEKTTETATFSMSLIKRI